MKQLELTLITSLEQLRKDHVIWYGKFLKDNPYYERYFLMNSDPEFVKLCRQWYEESRVFLRNCGKPRNDIDKFLIDSARLNCTLYRKYI